MPREITDRGRVVEAIQNLALTAELFEEKDGKQKYAGDLEVIVQGRDYGNGKRVGPYVRLLAYDGGEEVMRQGEWGGNTFYITRSKAPSMYKFARTGGKRRLVNSSGARASARWGCSPVLVGTRPLQCPRIKKP
jgi:hypothetical protein